jgi:diguanylate cyclase (GGDEF)-like protein
MSTDKYLRKPIPPIPSPREVGAYFGHADEPLALSDGPLGFNQIVKQQGYTNTEVSDAILTDGLTELPNKESVQIHFEQAYRKSRLLDADSSLAVIKIDIDNFGQINKQYGHPVGDRALKAVGRALKLVLRAGQTAARYGGEEFILILPNLPTDKVNEVFERIHRAFSIAMTAEFTDFPITASMGGVSMACPLPSQEPLQIFNQLDKAADDLQRDAKTAGKNRILFRTSI